MIKDYLKTNNIYNIEMNPLPEVSQNIIKNIYKYYNNYELITKNSFEILSSVFGIDNNNNKIELNVFLIDLFNYIFIKYNNYSAEIQNINKTEKYYIYSENYLEKIKNNFIKYGFTNGLSVYSIKLNKKFAEYNLLEIESSNIVGLLINLNALIIIKDNEEEDEEVIKNEEEVFEIETSNNIDISEEDEDKNIKLVMPKTSRYLNNVKIQNKDKNVSSAQCSLKKNIKFFNFAKNNFIIFNNISKREADTFKKNNSNIYNFKQNIPKSLNKSNNNNYHNYYINNSNNINIKKYNISNNFELIKKPNIANESIQKFKTPLNQLKQKKYFNKPSLNKNNFKFNQKKIDEGEEYTKETLPGLIGLLNIGEPYYMNPIINCFGNIQRLREELLNKNNYQKLYNGRNEKTKLTFALAEIFHNLWENKKIKNYSPKYFKKIISEMNPLFQKKGSKDTKDLILFILVGIHNELNQKLENIYNSYRNKLDFILLFNDFSNYYKKNNKSIISEEFYGFYNSMLKCCSCNTIKHNIKILNILDFPLEEVRKYIRTPYNFVTLENCFEYYESELLHNDNKILCKYCKNYSSILTQKKIIISPKTLIINLNRGDELQYNIGIQFEEHLNLKKYIFKSEESPYSYELVGVIIYLRSNDMGGHFIAYCKNSYDCEWYQYNGAKVTKSSFQEICKNGLPDVLFYSIIIV